MTAPGYKGSDGYTIPVDPLEARQRRMEWTASTPATQRLCSAVAARRAAGTSVHRPTIGLQYPPGSMYQPPPPHSGAVLPNSCADPLPGGRDTS